MSDSMSDGSLGIEEVKKRFLDSATALERAREQLAALISERESQVRTGEKLADASEKVSLFVDRAGKAAETLAAAQNEAVKTFDSMKSVVDGSDFREIKDEVEAISPRLEKLEELQSELSSANARVEDGVGAIGPRLEKLEQLQSELSAANARVHSTSEELATANEQLAATSEQFERLKVAASSRALKKAGLEGSPVESTSSK